MAKGYITIPHGVLQLEASDAGLTLVEWVKAEGQSDKHPLIVQAQKELTEYFNGKRRDFDVPLDVEGTAFQCKVWAAIGAVSFGKTITYGALAKKLKTSPRAVGGACGANPVPVIVPCHRIVGSDNKLTGYTGGSGVKTKQALLNLEQALEIL